MEHLVRRALVADNPARRNDRSDLDLNPLAAARYKLKVPPRPAAVLVPLVRREDGLGVILTRRADHLPTHKGQVAFPGGKIDPGDKDAIDCALRESEEEIGLDRSLVEIIGQLDFHITGTGFGISPIVGLLDPPFELKPEAGEVEDIFEVPLKAIIADGGLQVESREFGGHLRHYYAMNWEGFYIWGVTAAILKGFKELLEAAEKAGRS